MWLCMCIKNIALSPISMFSHFVSVKKIRFKFIHIFENIFKTSAHSPSPSAELWWQLWGPHMRFSKQGIDGATPLPGGQVLSLLPSSAACALFSCRQNPLPAKSHPGCGRQTPDTDRWVLQGKARRQHGLPGLHFVLLSGCKVLIVNSHPRSIPHCTHNDQEWFAIFSLGEPNWHHPACVLVCCFFPFTVLLQPKNPACY
jgi:hypothetical protein